MYRGVLYYLSGYVIRSYNIQTGTRSNNALRDLSSQIKSTNIRSFIITEHGFSVVYESDIWGVGTFAQISFSGGVIGEIENIYPYAGMVLVDIDFLVLFRPEGQRLVLVNLSSMETTEMQTEIIPGLGTYTASDGELYLYSMSYKTPGTMILHDLYSDEVFLVNIPDMRIPQNPNFSIREGMIYYWTSYGTGVMSIADTRVRGFSRDYILRDICFTSDGKLYAIAHDSSIENFLGATQYYIRMNIDGTGTEILD